MFSDLGRRENNTFIDKVTAQSSLPELFDLPVSSYTTYKDKDMEHNLRLFVHDRGSIISIQILCIYTPRSFTRIYLKIILSKIMLSNSKYCFIAIFTQQRRKQKEG